MDKTCCNGSLRVSLSAVETVQLALTLKNLKLQNVALILLGDGHMLKSVVKLDFFFLSFFYFLQ